MWHWHKWPEALVGRPLGRGCRVAICRRITGRWIAGGPRESRGHKQTYSAWDAAFNKKDTKAIAVFYTDDAYFLPPTHKVIEGPNGVAEFFSGLFKGGVSGHKLEMIEANGNGNIIYAAAK